MVVDNRIENTRNRDGGSGQYGNAINAHRAGNVIVRGNIIRQQQLHYCTSSVRERSLTVYESNTCNLHTRSPSVAVRQYLWQAALP
jgi:hypothetical protein